MPKSYSGANYPHCQCSYCKRTRNSEAGLARQKQAYSLLPENLTEENEHELLGMSTPAGKTVAKAYLNRTLHSYHSGSNNDYGQTSIENNYPKKSHVRQYYGHTYEPVAED